MTEAKIRAAVVAEARTWLNTPYRDGARVKGAGVDCGQLLVAVYSNVGVIEPFDVGYYSPQHHMHSNEERYLNYVMERSREVTDPGVGDLVMFKYGKCFSHGGIIIGWPMIIHALRLSDVTIENVERCIFGKRALANLPRKYFSPWGKE